MKGLRVVVSVDFRGAARRSDDLAKDAQLLGLDERRISVTDQHSDIDDQPQNQETNYSMQSLSGSDGDGKTTNKNYFIFHPFLHLFPHPHCPQKLPKMIEHSAKALDSQKTHFPPHRSSPLQFPLLPHL